MAELKCEQWREQYETLKKDWRDLGAKHSELESQLYVLQSKLQVQARDGRGKAWGKREGGPRPGTTDPD